MFKLVVLFCLVLTCRVQAKDNAEEEPGRMVNGQIINIAQAPYLVQLRYKYTNELFCGGSLISPTHVLTAAHCFDSMNPADTMVVAGANTRSDTGFPSAVAAYVISPAYSKATMNMDYAVLKLLTPIPSQFARTLQLCSRPVPAGMPVVVSGWGCTGNNMPGSHELRTIKVSTITQAECATRHGYQNPQISSAMLCAFSPTQDVCYADSGSAALVNGELCGIVSWGRGCAIGIPSIFTNVFELRAQIDAAVQSLH